MGWYVLLASALNQFENEQAEYEQTGNGYYSRKEPDPSVIEGEFTDVTNIKLLEDKENSYLSTGYPHANTQKSAI